LYAEMLESGVYGPLGEESHQAITSMVGATSRLTSIVSDLMDAALLERGLMPLVEADIALEQLLERAVSDAALLASSRSVRIEFKNECGDCVVRGDPVRLRQVVDNLLSNAIKYSFDSGIVQVELNQVDESMLVRVTDHGRGMPEAGRDALFDLFGRMDSNDARDVAGIGLGLAISRRIALAHRGRLYVESSAPGVGSVFVLQLPRGAEGTHIGLAATVSVE
jgi:signal transduction histidine kinase